MDAPIPLLGSATASYEKFIRADMMATGSSEVDIVELNITPELCRKTARRAARPTACVQPRNLGADFLFGLFFKE